MTTQQLLLLATCVYLALLVATVYFTRATVRRALGAFAGGASVAVVGVGVEVLCQTLGFWHYPSTNARYGLPLMYPLLAIAFTILALIGWRVTRRFDWRGQAVFLAAVTVVGTLRDYMIAGQAPGVIVFAPGIVTVLVDAMCWIGLVALAEAVMRLVTGPARGDPLARRPWEAV